MDGTATLTVTPMGLNLRLSHRGFTFDTLHGTVVDGETPTDTAGRMLAEHGWQPVDGWEQQRTGNLAQWAAVIDTTKEQ
ncbi:hypothetical protein [Micromonospora sp. NBC_00421]|uniref:hypothetical protein n=1 Tax=Micromonospora sp. NBC_00421 TaxID=2975976 RepID=UPI002E241A6B